MLWAKKSTWFVVWLVYIGLAVYDLMIFSAGQLLPGLAILLGMWLITTSYSMTQAMYDICSSEEIKSRADARYFWAAFWGAILIGGLWMLWPVLAAADLLIFSPSLEPGLAVDPGE